MLPIVLLLLATLNVHTMTNHVTKIEVLGKKPKQIYGFMFSLDKAKYIAWHPTEHKDFKIIKKQRIFWEASSFSVKKWINSK
jgi:hypothetical protein